MKKKHARWLGIAFIGAASAATALSWPSGSEATNDPPSLEELATDAVAEDPRVAGLAIEALRARGPEGHAALMELHADSVARLRAGEADEAGERLRHAIDAVSGQRDGHASGLYWHTDLDAARRAAAASGKPILSLRLLGRLDEELSCANSRFFRVVMYSDPEVAARLRDDFVLHWSTERPAPRIEIDMGDGRRMVRTITGNSVHYVLDAEGRPVDAIVGLYGPEQFLEALARARASVEGCAGAADRGACLAARHRAELGAMRSRWQGMRRREASLPSWRDALASMPDGSAGPAPSATAAMPTTIAKARIETPMLQLMRADEPDEEASAPPEPPWDRVAALSPARPLDARTRGLLRLKTGREDVEATSAGLAAAARQDGARNELLFRRRVHRMFAERRVPNELSAFNRQVYAELLLTPASDPWLGLMADDLYDGLEIEAD